MAKRISLHEFQAGLARRLAGAQDNRASALLAVQAGKRNWLVDLTEAGEILAVPPLAPVPLAQSWFRGLASVRGNLFGVVDFAAFHDDLPIAPVGHARLLLVGVRSGWNGFCLGCRGCGSAGGWRCCICWGRCRSCACASGRLGDAVGCGRG